jgi:NDP-sugar pyrophosphorylase family protein
MGIHFYQLILILLKKSLQKKKLSSLMTILKNNGKWDKSNVFLKNNQLIKYNKQNPSDDMNYIDYGLSILNSYIFDIYPENYFFDLSSVFEQLSKKNQLWGLEVYERFYEIGTSDSLKETENFISNLNY